MVMIESKFRYSAGVAKIGGNAMEGDEYWNGRSGATFIDVGDRYGSISLEDTVRVRDELTRVIDAYEALRPIVTVREELAKLGKGAVVKFNADTFVQYFNDPTGGGWRGLDESILDAPSTEWPFTIKYEGE